MRLYAGTVLSARLVYAANACALATTPKGCGQASLKRYKVTALMLCMQTRSSLQLCPGMGLQPIPLRSALTLAHMISSATQLQNARRVQHTAIMYFTSQASHHHPKGPFCSMLRVGVLGLNLRGAWCAEQHAGPHLSPPLLCKLTGVPHDRPFEGQSSWDSASITRGSARRCPFYSLLFLGLNAERKGWHVRCAIAEVRGIHLASNNGNLQHALGYVA